MTNDRSEHGASMVQECVESYTVTPSGRDTTIITITVSQRFRALWLLKLSQLYVTAAEMREYAPLPD